MGPIIDALESAIRKAKEATERGWNTLRATGGTTLLVQDMTREAKDAEEASKKGIIAVATVMHKFADREFKALSKVRKAIKKSNKLMCKFVKNPYGLDDKSIDELCNKIAKTIDLARKFSNYPKDITLYKSIEGIVNKARETFKAKIDIDQAMFAIMADSDRRSSMCRIL